MSLFKGTSDGWRTPLPEAFCSWPIRMIEFRNDDINNHGGNRLPQSVIQLAILSENDKRASSLCFKRVTARLIGAGKLGQSLYFGGLVTT